MIKKLISTFILLCLVIFGYVNKDQQTFLRSVSGQKYLTNVGISAFAIRSRNFKCKKFLDSLNILDILHIAVLWDSFGNKNDCLKSLMHDPRLKSLQIHMTWEGCIRNKDCRKSEFLRGYDLKTYENHVRNGNKKLFRKKRQYYRQVRNLFKDNLQPHTTCYISPGLESNLSDPAMRNLIRFAKRQLPMCKTVANQMMYLPNNVGANYKEYHGTIIPPKGLQCITNLDGVDISFPSRPSIQNKGNLKNIKSGKQLQDYLGKAARRCKLAFVWTRESNCYNASDKEHARKRPDPRSRTCKAGNVFRLVAREVRRAHRTRR